MRCAGFCGSVPVREFRADLRGSVPVREFRADLCGSVPVREFRADLQALSGKVFILCMTTNDALYWCYVLGVLSLPLLLSLSYTHMAQTQGADHPWPWSSHQPSYQLGTAVEGDQRTANGGMHVHPCL